MNLMNCLRGWLVHICFWATVYLATGADCPGSCVCFQQGPPGGLVVNCTSSSHKVATSTYPPTTEGLFLNRNDIDSLHGARLSGLSHLKNLSIAHNLVSSIPLGTFDNTMKQLALLDLSHNQLHEIPEGIPMNLKILNLGENVIQAVLVASLQNLIYLEELRLNNNAISEINCGSFATICPTCQPVLKHLRKLDLSNNGLQHICSEALHQLPSLKALALAGNKLISLEPGLFNLNSLQFLDLRSNQLREIRNGTFQKLTNLKYLYLKGNFLKEVPRDLPMLDWLDLSWNQITHVSEAESKNDLFPIEFLILSHNPLHCDCHLVWLKELMDRREYILNYISISAEDFFPSCMSPSELAGESWDLVADDLFKCPDDSQEFPGNQYLLKPRKTATFDDKNDNQDITVVHHEVRIRLETTLITANSITVRWKVKGRLHRDKLFIQYFEFGRQESTTLFSQVLATKSAHTINNLPSNSHYVICAIPKTEENELEPATEDQCINVFTLGISQWWEVYLEYFPSQESVWFHAWFLCVSFILSCVVIRGGLSIFERVSRKGGVCHHKEHSD